MGPPRSRERILGQRGIEDNSRHKSRVSRINFRQLNKVFRLKKLEPHKPNHALAKEQFQRKRRTNIRIRKSPWDQLAMPSDRDSFFCSWFTRIFVRRPCLNGLHFTEKTLAIFSCSSPSKYFSRLKVVSRDFPIRYFAFHVWFSWKRG